MRKLLSNYVESLVVYIPSLDVEKAMQIAQGREERKNVFESWKLTESVRRRLNSRCYEREL